MLRLTEQEQQEVLRYIPADKPLPDKYRFLLFGYEYALSSAGSFVGYDVLGKFFSENRRKPKCEVRGNATQFFQPFVHMVRPLSANKIGLAGSSSDQFLLVCLSGSGNPWGIIVFVRTIATLYLALLPWYDNAEQAVTYLQFLSNTNTEIRVAKYPLLGDKLTTVVPSVWPKKDIDLSEQN